MAQRPVGHLAAKSPVHALITGRPGVGKTTLVRKVAAALQEKGVNLRGFYTEEVRQDGDRGGGGEERRGRGGGGGGGGRGGPRIGFDVVSLDGQRGTLARIERPPGGGRVPTVGRYYVDTVSFERIALPTLQFHGTGAGEGKLTSPAEGRPVLVVIDEVGKMELFSRQFVDAVRATFEHPNVVVMATIPVARQKSHQLVEDLRHRADCQVFEVTERNRDGLVDEIQHFLSHRINLA